jgi:hypothetical protein
MTAARGRPSEQFYGAIGFPTVPASPGQHEERGLVRLEIPLEENPSEFDPRYFLIYYTILNIRKV